MRLYTSCITESPDAARNNDLSDFQFLLQRPRQPGRNEHIYTSLSRTNADHPWPTEVINSALMVLGHGPGRTLGGAGARTGHPLGAMRQNVAIPFVPAHGALEPGRDRTCLET